MQRTRLTFTATSALLVALGLACDDEKKASDDAPPKTVVSAKALAPSKSASKMAGVWSVSSDSNITFEMVGKIETIKGKVSGAKGELQVDLTDLTQTRGQIAVDVTTLTTHTFDDEGKDGKQTKDALVWLEVGEVTAANLRDEYRYATFAIREIQNASVKDVTKLTGAQRSAKVTAVGDFLLHGKKSEQTIELDVGFTFEGDTPKSLSIKTAKPFVVNLAGHEVKPRDNVGQLVAKVTQLLQDKVAETSSVSLELTASPTGREVKMGEAMPAAAVASAAAAATPSAAGSAMGATSAAPAAKSAESAKGGESAAK